MSWPIIQFDEAISSKGIFSDGNWVESKDQDPDGDVRLIQLADIGVGVFIDKSNRFMNTEAAQRLRCTYLQPGDILVARMPDPIGRACIFPNNMGTCVTVVDVCIVRPDSDGINNRWLMHLINSEKFKSQINQHVTGTTRQRISRGNLAKLEIPLPPLTEQKRIAAILDKADAIRRKRQQAIQLADEFLRAVFLEMFGDPVMNPKGWEVKRLGDVVKSQLGKMLSSKAKAGLSPKKYLRNANIRWRKIDISDLLGMDFNPKETEKFELKNGDLLVCEGGDVGRCSIWRDNVADCYYQKALHRVRPNRDFLTSEYVQEFFFWMSKRGGLSDSVSEVTFSHLTAEKLKELKIPVPPIDLQERFTEIYTKYESVISHYNVAQSVCNDSFNAISQKAFSGTL